MLKKSTGHSLFFLLVHPPQYHNQFQSTNAHHSRSFVRSTCPSFGSIVVLASLIHSLPAHNLNYFTAKLQLAFYLRRIPWMPVSAPIAMYVIPGVGWDVKLLEGWTNRLNEYDLIYSSLTDEHCFGYRLLGLVFWLMKRNL